MSTQHGHSHDALSRQDPTGTLTIRRQYAQRLRGAYDRINAVIREYVEEEDILGLGRDALVTPPSDFSFETDDAKLEGFEEWLNQAQEEEVLTVISRNDNRFIQRAYEKGIRDADRRLYQAGADIDPVDGVAAREVMRVPIHERKLQLIYSRNYRQLDGITNAVDQEVSRVLSEGLAEGRNPRDTGREIRDRIDKIGKTRSTTLARTETINAHAESTLTRYEQQGIEEVVGKAEFLTAQDDRVCDQCASLEGNTYDIDDARGVIPQHPRCRCTWIPVVSD